jgi:hypothetical protein
VPYAVIGLGEVEKDGGGGLRGGEARLDGLGQADQLVDCGASVSEAGLEVGEPLFGFGSVV